MYMLCLLDALYVHLYGHMGPLILYMYKTGYENIINCETKAWHEITESYAVHTFTGSLLTSIVLIIKSTPIVEP